MQAELVTLGGVPVLLKTLDSLVALGRDPVLGTKPLLICVQALQRLVTQPEAVLQLVEAKAIPLLAKAAQAGGEPALTLEVCTSPLLGVPDCSSATCTRLVRPFSVSRRREAAQHGLPFVRTPRVLL